MTRARGSVLLGIVLCASFAACVGEDPSVSGGPDVDRSDAGGPDSAPPPSGDGSVPVDPDATSSADGAAGDGGDSGQASRYVFVSSAKYTPIDVGSGVAAFDKLCNDLAHASPMPALQTRKFVAWMSTTSASASERTGAMAFAGSYQLVNDVVVATSGADLLDGTLIVPIDRDEKAASHPGEAPWTGTGTDGTLVAGANCTDWKGAAGDMAARGSTDSKTGAWTKNTTVTCSGDGPVYCFEVP